MPDTHTFMVIVSDCDAKQSEQVMMERLGYDEDYGFPYTLSEATDISYIHEVLAELEDERFNNQMYADGVADGMAIAARRIRDALRGD